MNEAYNSNKNWSRPPGLWGGVTMSNIIKFQKQSRFQRFVYPTSCVYNISNRVFVLTPGSCPRSGTWGGGDAHGLKKIDGDDD